MIELNEDVKTFFYYNKDELIKEINKRIGFYGEGAKAARKHLKYKHYDFTNYMFMNYHNQKYIFLTYSRQNSVELIKQVLLDIYNERKISELFKSSDLIINEHVIDEGSILPHNEVVIHTGDTKLSQCKESYFNFDIDKLDKAMSEEGETMPDINSIEELDEWLNRNELSEQIKQLTPEQCKSLLVDNVDNWSDVMYGFYDKLNKGLKNILIRK